MMTCTEITQPIAAPCAPRRVALVGRYAHQYLEEAMVSAPDYDVVFVESIRHAYSKIKRVLPDLVLVCLSSDEPDGCQVLSMLALDRDTSQIPVLTFMSSGSEGMRSDDRGLADVFVPGPMSLN